MKNLPNVIVNELEIFYPSHKIRAATFGRGLWESDLYYLANGIGDKNERQKAKISVFPNPSKGIFKVQMEETTDKTTEITVMSVTGETIEFFSVSGKSEIILNLSDYVSGIYFLKVENNHQILIKKIILQK